MFCEDFERSGADAVSEMSETGCESPAYPNYK